MLSTLQQAIVGLLPKRCLLCSVQGNFSYVCEGCSSELPWRFGRCCQCGSTLHERGLCEPCIQERPCFDRLYTLFDYSAPADVWVWQLKYKDKLHYAQAFAHWMGEAPWGRPQAILPVPLHPKRLQRRGFNQSLEIARPLGKALNLPVLIDSVERVKETPPQSRLSKIARQKNMKGAFSVAHPLPYQHIAIIDDVLTTGTTVSVLTKALKDAGVRQVDVWCVAQR